MSRNSGLVPELKEPRTKLQMGMLDKVLEDNKLLVRMFNEYLQSMIKELDYSLLLILTDVHGVVLSIIESLGASDCDIAVGTSLAIDSAGINAVSAAILLKRAVYMATDEHFLHIFKDWACICLPIRDQTGEIVAYINFPTSPKTELSAYYPYICLLVVALEFEMKRQISCLAALENKLLNFKLTPRQCEVAILWMSEAGYKSIARKLCISDKTVRTFIAEIYRKLNVHSKSEMKSMILKP